MHNFQNVGGQKGIQKICQFFKNKKQRSREIK